MHRLVVSLAISLLFAGWGAVPPACADFSHSYALYIEQGQDALHRGEYEAALDHFQHAHLIEPDEAYPAQQIAQIKRLLSPPADPSDATDDRTVRTYRLFLGLGKKAFARRQFEDSLRYLETANRIDPQGEEALHYINLIKRTRDQRVMPVKGVYETPPVFVQADQAAAAGEPKKVRPKGKNVDTEAPAPSEGRQKNPVPPSSPKNLERPKIVILDDVLWATQPKTDLRIELNQSLILESRNIDRFLVITPGVINVERLDRDHIKILAGRIGTTYLHVWDERGRWTFNAEVILPIQKSSQSDTPVNPEEVYADPLRFTYAIDGGTLYRGPDIPSAERESLTMQQTMALYGDTPYGVADASVGFNKFEESTEATSYSVGLSGARGAGFTNVNVRAFDASKYFSPLTFPGQYYRGILLEGKTQGENLGAAYVHGQDRYTYSFVSPGVIEERRSYVEGARVVLFPNEENQYAFNYARGYGPARQEFLQDEVYSVEARRRFQKALVSGEVATNRDNMAKTVTSKFGGDRARFRASFRDIDEDFTTITNLPSNQGEIGTLLSANYVDDRFEVSSDADIYQERLLSNPDDPNALNYDLDASVRVPLNDTTTWTTSGYYLDTPGELSPRRNFRLGNDLSKRYQIWGDRDLQTFVGSIYQRSRVPETPISDYDRYSLTTGFRLYLIRNLSYFTNYEYSWVDNLSADEVTNPSVLNSGLNYTRQLTDRLSGNLGFYYRNEQNTLGTNSFLAGEDSITGSVGMSYRPTDDSEVFWDSRWRNVWRENPENPAYNEIDVRWGLRSAWDLPVTWNPEAIVRGRVFKDLNGNGKRNVGEPGMANVHVRVGKQELTTDETGNYLTDVRAKKVLVAVDLSTVQPGYILTSPAVRDIRIPLEAARSIDFGFTTDSGIYGVVYLDENGNKQPDEGDVFVPSVKMILDNKITEQTEYDGTYFFKNVPGGKHTMRIDVNSLPIGYLPTVKVSSPIEVTEGTTYVYHVPLKRK
jgi:hypothetical protein